MAANLFIGFAPIARLRLRVRPVSLKGGAILDRRRLGPRVPGIRTAVTLCGRRAGKQKRRHCNVNDSHDSLDIWTGARMRAGRSARSELRRAPRSVRRQRASGGRSKRCSSAPGGVSGENRYLVFDGEARIESTSGPAMDADAQHAVHGPQCALFPSSACGCAVWSWPSPPSCAWSCSWLAAPS